MWNCGGGGRRGGGAVGGFYAMAWVAPSLCVCAHVKHRCTRFPVVTSMTFESRQQRSAADVRDRSGMHSGTPA